MNANVRNLALDIGLRWLLPLQLLLVLGIDYLYLEHPDLGVNIAAGIMLSLQARMAQTKVPLWRTLPVSRQEVGQARWWQMIGLPGLGLIAMMGAAIVLHAPLIAAGWDHHPLRADASAIGRALLLQFFYPVFLTLFWQTMSFARTSRAPWAIAAAVLVWAPWLLLLPHMIPILPAETGYLALGLAALVGAAILYVTAPWWPQPVLQPIQLDLLSGATRNRTKKRAGHSGWAGLCAVMLLRLALALGAVILFWVIMILTLDVRQMVVQQSQQFIAFLVVLVATQFNAMTLRLLRALPGSTLRLVAYLYLLPLALLAAASCGVSLVFLPWVARTQPQFDGVALSAAVMVGALALPAALGLRQMAMTFVVALTMVAVPLTQFGWHYLPAPWGDERFLAGLAAAAVCAGFFWMRTRISKGMQVYRFQPYVTPRWRGR